MTTVERMAVLGWKFVIGLAETLKLMIQEEQQNRPRVLASTTLAPL
jgi:hypothetical protein